MQTVGSVNETVKETCEGKMGIFHINEMCDIHLKV